MSKTKLPNFNDTVIAFQALSNRDLKDAYRLFKLMNYNGLVALGTLVTQLALKYKLPVKGLIKKSIFKQFCGGENLAEVKKVIDHLEKFNVHAILDYGVEAKESELEFDNTAAYLIETIQYATKEPYINIISSKITGLMRFDLLHKMSEQIQGNAILSKEEKTEYKKGLQRVESVSKAAHKAKVQIYFDAEESWIQPAIDNIVTQMMQQFNCEQPIIFNTIQLYRHDRLQFLKNAYQDSLKHCYTLAVKLVRGAYMEKERARAEAMDYEDPIQPDKAATDKDFNLALDFCMKHLGKIAVSCATHNEASTLHLANLIDKGTLSNNHPLISFAQLYGMSDHLTFNLAKAGYYVAKYLPYGPVKEVIPYLIRRADENSSVDGQWSREFSLVKAEMKRRDLI